MTYLQKVQKALSKLSTLEELYEVERAINITKQVNRRTKAGRELTQQCQRLCNEKALELIDKGATPVGV